MAALASFFNKMMKDQKRVVTASVASVLGLIVPLQMVSQTWDDHDRSDRYACRDFGLNYLNTLPENGMPIIFTNGDNDTFPLWYAQETEGQRTDARVCNLSYLQTDWYTDQMRRPAYNSASLPIAWNRYEYVDNRGKGFDYYEVRPEMKRELDAIKAKTGVNTYDLKYIIDHYVRARVANEHPRLYHLQVQEPHHHEEHHDDLRDAGPQRLEAPDVYVCHPRRTWQCQLCRTRGLPRARRSCLSRDAFQASA